MTTKAEVGASVKRTPRKKVVVAREVRHPHPEISRPQAVVVERVERADRTRPLVARVNKQWFLDRMEERGWRGQGLRELARRMNLDVSAVSLMLDGKRKMTAAEAGKIAHHLGVPVQDVLANAGVDVSGAKSHSVPLSGWVAPEGKVHLGRVQGPATVSGPAEGGEDLAALRVQGGALDGWVLFYRRQAPGVRPEAVGKLCVVVEAAGEGPEGVMRVGWVRPGYEAGMWSLGAMDASVDRGISQVRLESAVPVSWIRQ